MKTRKIAFAGFMASILMASGAAFATDEPATALTTKGYVDAGLRAVYGVASAAADKNLSNITETGAANVSAKGTVDLTKDDYDTGTVGKALVDINSAVDGLDTAVTNLGTTVSGKANASDVYTKTEADNKFITDLSAANYSSDQDSGVTVDNTNRKIKLSVPAAAANDGNAYVYKNGAWAALDVENTWDASILTAQE